MTTLNPNPIIIKKLGSGGGRSSGVRIPGVFPSVRFGEHVVSTGIPSLDISIGGGVPLGSILLIEDSFFSKYGDLILKCFLAEGASYNHHLYIGSGKIPSSQFIQELPSIKKDVTSQGQGQGHGDNESEGMKIAWRYHHQEVASPSSGIVKTQKKSKFEFKKKSNVEELGGQMVRVTMSSVFESDDLNIPNYVTMLKEIACTLQPFKLNSSSSSQSLLRIGLSHCEDQILCPQFMTGLRSLVRHTNSCAVLTVSASSSNPAFLKRCEGLADIVIQVQAILEDKRKSELGDVDGLCKITKLSSVNSLKLVQSSRDLGLVFKRKQIVFQELHLPPEGEDTVQREVATSRRPPPEPIASSSSCGSVKGKSIDF